MYKIKTCFSPLNLFCVNVIIRPAKKSLEGKKNKWWVFVCLFFPTGVTSVVPKSQNCFGEKVSPDLQAPFREACDVGIHSTWAFSS